MRSGALWCLGGLLVTGITYTMAANSPAGGTYIIAWGAIVFGAVRFFQGFFGQDGQPSAEQIAFNALGYGARLEAEGKIAEAVAVYQSIIEKYPQSDASNDAKKSIENLQAHLS